MGQIVFDEEMARQLEAVYRIRDAVRRRGLVREKLAAKRGEHILDVGCGPGFYCLELADAVGEEGAILGIDSSDPMLSLAERRCEGLAQVSFEQGDALSLPVEDETFDAALSVQVLEYVEDVPAALDQIHRALRPGGRVVIWDVDWATTSVNTEDAARTERMLAGWDEHLTHPSLPRRLTADLRRAGFEDVEMDGHVFATNRLDIETYGGYLVSFLADFVRGRGSVPAEEIDAWEAEQQELEDRGEFYFAVIQFCFVARKPRRG